MSELFQKFGVEWKLLFVQAINFGIVILILRHFVYKPIRTILERRRLEIEKGLRFSAEAESKIKEIETTREAMIRDAYVESNVILTKAQALAREEEKRIVEETTKKSEVVVLNAKRLIEEERRKTEELVWQSSQELIRTGIAKVLHKMKPEERDEVFIKEALQELKSAHK